MIDSLTRFVCQFHEMQGELISLPNGNDITLKPIETYEMPIRLSAKEEGALINHLEVTVEDGKIM